MKKVILILALCLLSGSVVQAQTSQNKKEKQEVVKLKNGHSTHRALWPVGGNVYS